MLIKKLYPIVIIFLGIVILISDQPLEKNGVFFDFTEIKFYIGPFLIFYGIYWLWLLYKKK